MPALALLSHPDMTACTYTAAEQVNAWKGMVKAFHAQGIEVWLDVVYNHTWEGGACSGNPVRYVNLRGIDRITTPWPTTRAATGTRPAPATT